MEENTQVVESDKKLEKKANVESAAEDLIRRTNEAAERLERANTRFAEHRAALAADAADKILQGQSEVGVPKKEETPTEYKNRIMRGEL